MLDFLFFSVSKSNRRMIFFRTFHDIIKNRKKRAGYSKNSDTPRTSNSRELSSFLSKQSNFSFI